ncbi:uncharacterized protein LOC117297683 [Asterias rubens]|uniref:uncharacterized protein LOC117297683 n=1 Tax=Asterias rubens TaxID=7604 RepID=UPI001455C944|nr:uncharacterized protein LOC117297683 [Asterias rubens]
MAADKLTIRIQSLTMKLFVFPSALDIKDKSTSQSSTHHEYPAENAVDGSVATFSQTANDGTDSNPWWQLDLGGEFWLGRITVMICKDSPCGAYFNGVTVRAGLSENYTENTECTSLVTSPSNGAVLEFLCDPPALAQYISMDKDQATPSGGGTILRITEVSVYEYASEECASQSVWRLRGSK